MPQFGQTEVQNLGVAIRTDDYVLRFEIAVNDAALVRCRDSGGDLRPDAEGIVQRKRAVPKAITQALSGDQLHGDEAEPILGADLEDGGDVGVIECRCGLGLLHEAAHAVGRFFGALAEHLDRNFALEVVVVGEVHLAHSASAEERSHFVPAEVRAGCDGHAL